ncbi:MAG: helix-turn-helix domain-containing protein [bacterium]
MKLTTEDIKVKLEEILWKLIEQERDQLPYTLGVKELVEILPHSKTKIYLMLEDGELPGKKLGGKWLVPRTHFLAWLAAVEIDESIYERTRIKVS